jgi:hypothetical protein
MEQWSLVKRRKKLQGLERLKDYKVGCARVITKDNEPCNFSKPSNFQTFKLQK